MKIHLGAGEHPITGFVNMDVRPLPGVIRGEAHRLAVEDGTVDLIFSNAMFEHLFFLQQVMAMKEWERVLAPDGVAVCCGIPNFEAVAKAYVEKAPGIMRPTFDLLEVYRYTHGSPEVWQDNASDWLTWSSADRPDQTPPGWLPQLHKAIFDAESLVPFCEAACGLQITVVRYPFPGETLPLNLGFVAGHSKPAAVKALEQVPVIGKYVDLERLEVIS